jgi:hypothetical protein
MPRAALTLLMVSIFASVAACGGDSTSPSAMSVQGTYIGDYTVVPQPGAVYQGVLQLSQSGSSVTGTLSTNAGRSATVTGSIANGQLTMTFAFTDSCTGSASSTADISNGGNMLVGNYTANDCVGQYSGGYRLVKQ